ncbi:hypothetical protein Trco_000157 [Trichoderma cornu-damae]|uniref:Uncharacterized protein n=1 Tax=Trichoderma cornu-damae TaxID=654480 RepID=A0A9P8QWY4_9HYPO|nr:hypothetical protein Trco_000157 [Trichoderma cornu-damae]
MAAQLLLFATLCAKLATAQDNEEAFRPAKPGCTSTMTLTLSRLPTPPYWPQCSWDGTLSIFPATVTLVYHHTLSHRKHIPFPSLPNQLNCKYRVSNSRKISSKYYKQKQTIPMRGGHKFLDNR